MTVLEAKSLQAHVLDVLPDASYLALEKILPSYAILVLEWRTILQLVVMLDGSKCI